MTALYRVLLHLLPRSFRLEYGPQMLALVEEQNDLEASLLGRIRLAAHLIPDLVAALTHRGVRLTRVEPHRPTLEDLYFRVRREHREQTGSPAPAMSSDEGVLR